MSQELHPCYLWELTGPPAPGARAPPGDLGGPDRCCSHLADPCPHPLPTLCRSRRSSSKRGPKRKPCSAGTSKSSRPVCPPLALTQRPIRWVHGCPKGDWLGRRTALNSPSFPSLCSPTASSFPCFGTSLEVPWEGRTKE